jgi:stage II sporulation protein R
MKYKKLILALTLIILAFVYIGYPYIKDQKENIDGLKRNIIRFHVIANSDSEDDQALKLKIRDRILNEMGEQFENSSSIDESRRMIESNMDTLKYIAEDEIKKDGKDYMAQVYLGEDDFPTKSYGGITFPAGEYEALKVVIGEGKGKNWWCVMFPPLCFVDITHGISGDVQEELKEVLSEDEYELILSDKKPHMKLKSKTVEIFKKTKTQFAKLFIGEN